MIEMVNRKLIAGWLEIAVHAVMAGVYISLGATFMLACRSAGMPPIVCGLAFSMGLWLVMCLRGELFTGNCLLLGYMGYSVEVSKVGENGSETILGKIDTTRKIALILIVSYIGNIIGSLFFALLVGASGIDIDAASLVKAKMSLDLTQVVVRGILCNICVCLAVYVGTNSKGTLQKLAACAMPVACFVTCGWEHCVADMFILPLGGCDPLDAMGFICFATLGNVIGAEVVTLGIVEEFGWEKTKD